MRQQLFASNAMKSIFRCSRGARMYCLNFLGSTSQSCLVCLLGATRTSVQVSQRLAKSKFKVKCSIGKLKQNTAKKVLTKLCKKRANDHSGNKHLCKKIILNCFEVKKNPNGVLGFWGFGGAVWLERPIDSMTWRLSPAPVFLLGPISARLGPGTAEFCSGEARKNGV